MSEPIWNDFPSGLCDIFGRGLPVGDPFWAKPIACLLSHNNLCKLLGSLDTPYKSDILSFCTSVSQSCPCSTAVQHKSAQYLYFWVKKEIKHQIVGTLYPPPLLHFSIRTFFSPRVLATCHCSCRGTFPGAMRWTFKTGNCSGCANLPGSRTPDRNGWAWGGPWWLG